MSVNSSAEKLKIAISPCPNDTFAFFHFINDYPEKYSVEFLDIEELNQGMMKNKWDMVKASFTSGLLNTDYELLPSGSAIGFGVGPVAVYANEKIKTSSKWITGLPGENTTASFLWDYFVSHQINANQTPEIKNIEKKNMKFSEILDNVASGKIDLGILIHEGRFVYQNYGLKLYIDLGEFWQNSTGYPVPLGGIFLKSNLAESVKTAVKNNLKYSVEKAILEKNEKRKIYTDEIIPFIKKYSRESSQKIIEQHIETYVTDDTVLLRKEALDAIMYFRDLIKDKK